MTREQQAAHFNCLRSLPVRTHHEKPRPRVRPLTQSVRDQAQELLARGFKRVEIQRKLNVSKSLLLKVLGPLRTRIPKRPVTWAGVNYPSILACAKANGVSPKCIRLRLGLGR